MAVARERVAPLRNVVVAALLGLLVGNLGRIPVLAGELKSAPVLASDLTLLVAIAAGIAAIRARRLPVRLDGVTRAAIGFVLVGAGSAVLAIPRFGLTPFQVAFSLAYLARWMVYFSVYVVTVQLARREQATEMWRGLETTILVFAAFGLFQSAFLPGFAQIVYPDSDAYLDWDPQGNRLVSSFLDPNFAGGFIMMGLLVHAGLAAAGARVPLWRPLLLVLGVLATLSRSSILASLAGIVVIVLMAGIRRRLLKQLGAAALVLLAILPVALRYAVQFNKLHIDASALERVINWWKAWVVITQHPLIGVGFNTWGYVQQSFGWLQPGTGTFGIDGGLLFIAALTGLLGLACYVAMIVVVVRRARAAWKDTTLSADARGLAIGIAAVTIAMPVHSLFTTSLLLPFLMAPLWWLWGIGFALVQRPADETAAAPAAARRPRPMVVSLAAPGGRR